MPVSASLALCQPARFAGTSLAHRLGSRCKNVGPDSAGCLEKKQSQQQHMDDIEQLITAPQPVCCARSQRIPPRPLPHVTILTQEIFSTPRAAGSLANAWNRQPGGLSMLFFNHWLTSIRNSYWLNLASTTVVRRRRPVDALSLRRSRQSMLSYSRDH